MAENTERLMMNCNKQTAKEANRRKKRKYGSKGEIGLIIKRLHILRLCLK